jgi:hypothetical protein
MADDDPFVPIIGVIYLHTSLGVFLDTESRRAFIPDLQMLAAPRRLTPGETATIFVRQSYANKEGLLS